MQVFDRNALQNSINTGFLYPCGSCNRGQGLNAILLSATPEGGLIDTENSGGLLKRSCGGQNVTDMFFLNFVQGYRVSQFDRCLARLQVVREVADADPIRPAENDGPFNNVT